MLKSPSVHARGSQIIRRSSTISSGKTCKARRSGQSASKSSLSTAFEGAIVNLFKSYYGTTNDVDEPTVVICTEDMIDKLSYVCDPKVIFVGKMPLTSEVVEQAIFRNCPIDDTTVNALIGCSVEYKTLTVLRLEFCNLSAEHVSTIANNLHNTRISDLSLNGNTADKEQNFFLLLEKLRLKNLSLKYCSINSEGMSMIADKLSKPSGTLLVLNLASNMLYDEGAEHAARMLRSNRTLLSLNLADNKITDKGCKYIMQSLVEFELLPDEVYFKRKRNYEKLKSVLNANLNPSEEVLPGEQIAAKKSPPKNMIKEKSSGSLARRGSSKSKDKSAASVASQTSSSQNAMLDPSYHPFINDITEDHQTILCKGNDVVINLNLSCKKSTMNRMYPIGIIILLWH
ncbi:unnamed protein product [Callosobruchus maculatus]|uniref:Leucine-rich repeat-containing protein 71 n=1 Tax=Callosobruchus maculatus TaxID=64391 RepID=A0A653BVV0_CALMS|nr:unnamed protein product [Callosobruchus maculatus]